MKAQSVNLAKPSFWQLVFLQSKVNGARYNGEWLPGNNWKWPENTYLQRQRERLRRYRSSDFADLNNFDDAGYKLLGDKPAQEKRNN
jgi:hypothetical protein